MEPVNATIIYDSATVHALAQAAAEGAEKAGANTRLRQVAELAPPDAIGAIVESLEQSIADLSGRLDAERRAPGGIGQQALDRDLEIHRLTGRLRALRRLGLDLCLGGMVGAAGGCGALAGTGVMTAGVWR